LNFTSVSFEYAHRNCNKVANAMVALDASMAHGNGQLWPDDVPNDVMVLVASDLATPTG
jgi:hypothetical protein